VRIVLASGNAHKARELGRLLEGWEVETFAGGLPEETGETFVENARLKARHVHAALGGAEWVLADDSGIEAAALHGVPGVRSARYAGEDATDEENLAKLRAEAPPGSRLRYVCVIAHVAADGTEHLFEGACTGTMSAEARGEGGFGYDPIFVPDDPPADGRTMAELSDAEKDAISHRGRAARKLLDWLGGG
jgi:XTP/dITP diphosphohydrolase